MRGLTFFAKMVSYAKGGYPTRVSSLIRAGQISAHLGAKLNPTKGYQDDVCIYIKPHVKPGNDFKFEGIPYLDIVDGFDLRHLLRMHPEVTIIACSKADVEHLGKYHMPNKIIFIPQHHCNFERVKRDRTEVKVVGTIGTIEAFKHIPDEIRKEIAKRGMEYIEFHKFLTRQDVVDFYKKIDLQLVWRPYKKELSNPLKIVNASSFGISTIALDEPAFKEMDSCYVGINGVEGFGRVLDALRSSPALYGGYALSCLEKSQEYHIEKVAKLYQALCQT